MDLLFHTDQGNQNLDNDSLGRILQKAAKHHRLTKDELLVLAEASTPDDVHKLGRAAFCNRALRHGNQVTFVHNLQINPSNLCVNGCRFCRFSAKEGDPNAYVLDEQEIFDRIAEIAPMEVHIVGGLNRQWDYARSLNLVAEIRARFADIYIKAFTAVEMDWFAKTAGLSIEDVLISFKNAGLQGMPGGGAEIFATEVREKQCTNKISGEAWLRIHKQAAGLGIVSNATMLVGLGETTEQRIDHLLTLRQAQDETNGFSSFIPLFYHPGHDAGINQRPAPLQVLSIMALSRFALDNFDHIKAYWPMIGLETAAVSLYWGADDLDGTIGGERIAHAAGAKTPRSIARKKMIETITLSGFVAVERNGLFNAIQRPDR